MIVFNKCMEYINSQGAMKMSVVNNKSVLASANRMSLELHHFARGTYPVAGRELHALPVNRFFMVISNPGGDRCRIEDDRDSFICTPGCAYFAPLHHPCRFILDKDLEFVSIHFTLELYEGVDIFSSFGKICQLRDKSFLRRAQKAFDKPAALTGALELRSLVAGFAALQADSMTEEQWENVSRFAPFKKELAYLQNTPPARVTVEELAELHGVSRENFSRSFTRITGMTPKQFLTQITVNRACRKLISEKNTIREIALELGFSNEFYFSNFFRKHTGGSPREYRRSAPLK